MVLRASKATKELLTTEQQQGMKSEELTETFKGRLIITDPDKSEIAKNLKINKKGIFAVKIN